MIRFLVDNQLPAALARWLQARNCVAEHVLDLGLAQAADDVIWTYAVAHGAVIVTKDEDYSLLSLTKPDVVPIVWIRVGNCRTHELLTILERAWPQIVDQLNAQAAVVEVQ